MTFGQTAIPYSAARPSTWRDVGRRRPSTPSQNLQPLSARNDVTAMRRHASRRKRYLLRDCRSKDDDSAAAIVQAAARCLADFRARAWRALGYWRDLILESRRAQRAAANGSQRTCVSTALRRACACFKATMRLISGRLSRHIDDIKGHFEMPAARQHNTAVYAFTCR